MEVTPGLYKHYKGDQYEVIGVAIHTETSERLVVYQAVDGDRGFFVRPMAMFLETVAVEGKKLPRFRKI
jgi:hypothetical protein